MAEEIYEDYVDEGGSRLQGLPSIKEPKYTGSRDYLRRKMNISDTKSP